MTWERQRAYDYSDGHDAGYAEGAKENAIANAKNFLKEGDSPDKVARCCSLPLEQVLALKAGKVLPEHYRC